MASCPNRGGTQRRGPREPGTGQGGCRQLRGRPGHLRTPTPTCWAEQRGCRGLAELRPGIEVRTQAECHQRRDRGCAGVAAPSSWAHEREGRGIGVTALSPRKPRTTSAEPKTGGWLTSTAV